jgi:proteasome lid subunit RPN8/RPN11
MNYLEARAANGATLQSGSQPSRAARSVFEKLARRGYLVAVALAAAPALAGMPVSTLPVQPQAFDTLDDAAKAAEAVAMPLSASFEYGGVILEHDGRYYFTQPVTSHERTHLTSAAAIPNGYHLAALFHSHPGSDGVGAFFSTTDVSTAEALHVPSYIGVLADGTVRRFRPGITPTINNAVAHGISPGEVIT